MLLRFKTRATDRRLWLTLAAVNRPTLMHMDIVLKAENDGGDIWWPSNCNAFIIATLSS